MSEATLLYSVTAVVVAGLAVWVAAVLKTAKEPWARPAPALLEQPVEPAAALVAEGPAGFVPPIPPSPEPPAKPAPPPDDAKDAKADA